MGDDQYTNTITSADINALFAQSTPSTATAGESMLVSAAPPLPDTFVLIDADGEHVGKVGEIVEFRLDNKEDVEALGLRLTSAQSQDRYFYSPFTGVEDLDDLLGDYADSEEEEVREAFDVVEHNLKRLIQITRAANWSRDEDSYGWVFDPDRMEQELRDLPSTRDNALVETRERLARQAEEEREEAERNKCSGTEQFGGVFHAAGSYCPRHGHF